MSHQKRLVVIGGGAAGFFCAVNAARLDPSLQVTILEKTGKVLSKVKVSGGGRCNVTHACYSISDMVRRYPRGANFLKKAFHHFFTTDTIQWFKERGVELKTEPDGRMFPVTDSSQTIIDCLVGEVNKYGVEIRMMSEVRRVESGVRSRESGVRSTESGKQSREAGAGSQESGAGKFLLELSDSRLLTTDYICVACGGYPKTSMFGWLQQLGHTIEEPVPSLFTFNIPGDPVTALMGVSVPEAEVKVVGSKLSAGGPLLITHWGLSGPAILRLSAWGARELAASQWQCTILVNWLPGYNEQTLREAIQETRSHIGSQLVIHRNPFGLPNRLWQYLLEQSGIHPETRWAALPAKEQNRLIKNCCAREFHVKGKTTYKEEFVTAGGIRLTEIDVNTMQSKLAPGLFFAGEILDVDGITGGFNFQHAWTSGYIAAHAIASHSLNIEH